jgi:hypothetical protein
MTQTRNHNPRQAIAARVRKNLRFDPRAKLVREVALAMKPSKATNIYRAKRSKGK